MKTLIIAEKPSVAGDIAIAMGESFKKVGGSSKFYESDSTIISNAIGHLVQLYVPEAEKTGKTLNTLPVVPEFFSTQVIDQTKDQFKLLESLMRREDVGVVVNACDAGREGELIFRLIYDHARCRKPTKRMWLQSMTKDAIKAEVRNMRPGTEFDRLYDAAKSRSEADWLVGINATRGNSYLRSAQTGSYQTMNVGRVQTPTLAIVVDRENEIKNFKPINHFEVTGTFGTKSGDYVGKWFREQVNSKEKAPLITDRAVVDAIVQKCKGAPVTDVTETTKPSLEHAPKLFDLTTLQREANKKFKFSAKDTLAIAQSLYEKHKATTYPRTDATALPEDYLDTAVNTLQNLSNGPQREHAQRVLQNSWVKSDKRIFDNSKISDHFAIIPTGQIPSNLSADEAKIYDLIVKRFIAVFHPAAEYSETVRITTVAQEKFKSSGKVMMKEGWRAVYGAEIEDESKTPRLAAVAQGETPANKDIEVKTLTTKPPSRHTEASLLGFMETAGKSIEDESLREAMKEVGLGTPATRAATIEGLLSKGTQAHPKEPYLVREGNYLVPTGKAMELIHFLRETGMEQLTSASMTGAWEQKLLKIEQGQYKRKDFIAEIASTTKTIIESLQARKPAEESVPGCHCQKCGGGISIGMKAYQCNKGCTAVWKEIAGRKISKEEAAALIRDGKTVELNGFVSAKTKKPFSAALVIDAEGKTTFSFLKTAPDLTLPKLKSPCPKCGGSVHVCASTYTCANGDFNMFRVIADRQISEREAEFLLEKRVTPKFNGFMSKKRKVFDAGLYLDEEFKVSFYFNEPPSPGKSEPHAERVQ